MVEVDHVASYGLARIVRKEAASEPPYRKGKWPGGGFQVALQAHLQLPLRRKPPRIQNIATGRLMQAILRRTVAAAAIDPLGEWRIIHRGCDLGARWELGVAVVAEEAIETD